MKVLRATTMGDDDIGRLRHIALYLSLNLRYVSCRHYATHTRRILDDTGAQYVLP